MTKTCRVCLQALPLEDFYHNRSQSLGRRTQCKKCEALTQSDYKKAWRLANIERVRQQKREYRALNAERIRAKKRAERHAHPEKNRLRGQRFRERNREYIRQYHQAYRQKNLIQLQEKKKIYYQNNATFFKESNRLYRELHKEKVREWGVIHAQRRRAWKKHGTKASLTLEQWRFIKEHYKYRCVYCGKHSNRPTQDHIIPLSKGGTHTLDNIVPACKSCNSRKNAGPPLSPVQPLLALDFR